MIHFLNTQEVKQKPEKVSAFLLLSNKTSIDLDCLEELYKLFKVLNRIQL